MKANRFAYALAASAAWLLIHPPSVKASTDPGASSPPESVRQLMQKDLIDVPGMEARMLTVEYLPGGASLPHRHGAQVFVYVLSGTVRMQVRGGPVMTLGPGGTFYEGRDDIHTVSANASRTKPAKLLVFMVKNKEASTGETGEKK